MLKRRAVWNSCNSNRPKEIWLIGLAKIGSHTARMAASKSSTRVSRGIQPARRWASATAR